MLKLCELFVIFVLYRRCQKEGRLKELLTKEKRVILSALKRASQTKISFCNNSKRIFIWFFNKTIVNLCDYIFPLKIFMDCLWEFFWNIFFSVVFFPFHFYFSFLLFFLGGKGGGACALWHESEFLSLFELCFVRLFGFFTYEIKKEYITS